MKHDLRTFNLTLLLGFGLLLALMIAQMSVSISEILSLRQHMAKLVEEKLVKNELAQIMLDTSRERALLVMQAYFEEDPFEVDQVALRYSNLAGEFMTARKQMYALPLSVEERKALDRSLPHAKQGTIAMDWVMEQITLGMDAERQEKAHFLMKKEAIPAREKVGESMREIRRIARESSQRAIAEAEQNYRRVLRLLWALGAGILAVSLVIVRMVYKRVTDTTGKLNTMNQQLDQIARHDVLTGLANRRCFQGRLVGSLARAHRYQQSCALLYLDLDGFKAVNDRHGHACGDIVLKVVAERFLKQVRDIDYVARLGGDEFAIFLENVGAREGAQEVAERILRCLHETIDLQNGHHAPIGVSIGIALYPHDGENSEALVQQADQAMYAAKTAGKNGFRFASVA